MAVKARAEITVSVVVDVKATYRYYLLQSSTASAPAKPTTYPPTGSWTDTEPTYTEGSTNSLYIVDCTVFCDDAFNYSNVSKSSSYEAAKTAYNKAVAAQNAANAVQNAIDVATDVIVGTQTTATGAWTGVAKFSELKDGQSIMYWLPYKGSGNATLNLTLANGTTTGAIACYYTGTTRLTTHYGAGSVIRLVYKKNVSIAGSGSYTGWWADANYDSNSYDRTRYAQAIKCGTTAIVAANIIVGNNGVYKHLKAGTAFDISYPILYANAAIAASATGTNNYVCMPFTVTTTQNTTLTAYKPVYIKGTLSGTSFTPVSTAPLTQTVPTSDDGYDYILLGQAYSTTAMYLLPEHPVFKYHNGAFKSFEQIAVEASEKTFDLQEALDKAVVTLEGIVAFKSNVNNGTATVINGGAIMANTITANKINVIDLFAQDIVATGSITGQRFISSGTDWYGQPSTLDIDAGRLRFEAVEGNNLTNFTTDVSAHQIVLNYKNNGGELSQLWMNGNLIELTMSDDNGVTVKNVFSAGYDGVTLGDTGLSVKSKCELLFNTGTTQSATKGIKWSAINSKNPYIGYATDQTDGTFVVGSLLGTNYASGLAIGGGSGNLLWKGAKVITASDTASTSANGLMTTAMVTKLNGIAAGANAYTHPSYTARTGVPTANATLSFGGTFTVSQPVSDATGHITAINSRTYTMPSDRLFTTLVPTGTRIGTTGTDLNTIDYIKVGRYYCSANATAKTLVNCPTNLAFMMEVYSPLSTTIDNESTGTYVYRLRKLTEYSTGKQYIQYVSSSSTAGTFTYGSWYSVPIAPFTLDTSDSNDGSGTVGSATKPVYLNDSVVTACSTYAGGTAVTLNGSSKAASTASFYAPTAVGTSGQVLISAGSGAPAWKSLADAGIAESGHTHNKVTLVHGDVTREVVLACDNGNTTGLSYFRPNSSSYNFYLGTSSTQWYTAYFKTSISTSSDRRLKKNFSTDMGKYIAMLDLIAPTSYELIEAHDSERYVGYIAQDVEAAMNTVGLADSDFAGLNKSINEDTGEVVYSLRYEQFIPGIHAKVNDVERRHQSEIDRLKARLDQKDVQVAQLYMKIAEQQKIIDTLTAA